MDITNSFLFINYRKMLFLTEIKNNKRPFSTHHSYNNSLAHTSTPKFVRQPFGLSTATKSKSVHHNFSRRERSNIELERSIEAIKNKSQAKQKWQKIVEMFHLFQEVNGKNTVNSNPISSVATPLTHQSSLNVPFSRTTTRARSKLLQRQEKPLNKHQRIDSTGLYSKDVIESGSRKMRFTGQSEELQTENKIKNEQKTVIERINLFECILKANIADHKYRFNIPETILLDEQRSFQLLFTDHELLMKRTVHKGEIFSIFERGHESSLKKIKNVLNSKVYQQMYQYLMDTKINPMAPFALICFEQNNKNLTMEVESARNFGENRWDANKSCYAQRYVFSRNLKAMVLRMVYDRVERGQQKQEYTVYRFQNYAGIFRSNSNGINDFLDFKAKVSPSQTREYTLQYSKLTGPGVLNRFIEPTTEIRKLIQSVSKRRVKKLWIDFIEDIAGTLWTVGVKGVQFQQKREMPKKSLWQVSVQVGSCRLCNGVFVKSELQNSVSVRMLLEFLHHLRRRTRIEDLKNVQFANMSAMNRKEKAMSAVCECCYALIINELYLKKCEKELGKLCNIRIEDEGDPPKNEGRELYQWRLMIYLQEIYQETKQFYGEFNRKKIDNVIIRCMLAKGMQEKWRCRVQQNSIPVKRVKIHYFFSEKQSIEEFLKNTEVLVSVLSGEKEEVIAQGSTGILANFRNKFVIENGQRQTTTVLLFFQSGKYCALTLKVGLVYDGKYKVPQMPMRKVHSVQFPVKQCLNSNPLPKQWLQAIGFDKQIQLKEVHYQDLLKEKTGVAARPATGLKKKVIRSYW